jgi:hypothetical protein
MSSSKIFIDPLVGNVGIGVANPTAKLHVLGNARIQGDLIVNGSQTTVNNYTTVSSNVSIMNTSGVGPALRVAQTGSGAGYPVADFYDNDVSTTVPAMRIADGGNVGIGTANPQAKLDVSGNVILRGNIQHLDLFVANYPLERWLKMGTYTCNTNGSVCTITICGGAGYDHTTGIVADKNCTCIIELQSGNGQNLNIGGYYYNVGLGGGYCVVNGVYVVTSQIITTATSWDVYCLFAIYVGSPSLHVKTDATSKFNINPSVYLSTATWATPASSTAVALPASWGVRPKAGALGINLIENGNVGIGTTNPLSTLHVSGNIKASVVQSDTFQIPAFGIQPNSANPASLNIYTFICDKTTNPDLYMVVVHDLFGTTQRAIAYITVINTGMTINQIYNNGTFPLTSSGLTLKVTWTTGAFDAIIRVLRLS